MDTNKDEVKSLINLDKEIKPLFELKIYIAVKSSKAIWSHNYFILLF